MAYRVTLRRLQVFFMAADPGKCLAEAMRALKPGGVLACSSWQHSQWEELLSLITKVRPEKCLPKMREGWDS